MALIDGPDESRSEPSTLALTPGQDPILERAITDVVAEVWRRRFGDLAVDVDVRHRGSSSIDLLDLELDLRRRTRRSIRIESIEGPIDLASITDAVRVAAPSTETVASPVDPSGRTPATAALAEQWLHERIHPSSRAYLVPILIPLRPDTRWRDLSAAVTRLVDTHPMLRTAVVEDPAEEGVLVQRIDPSPRIVLVEPRVVAAIDDAAIRTIVDDLGPWTPSIRSGRPYRAFGLERDGRLEALLMLVHHGVVDDHSIRILADDLGRRLQGGDAIEEELTIAARGRMEASRPVDPEELAWWRARLAGRAVGLRLKQESPAAGGSHRRVVHLGIDVVNAIDREIDRVDGSRSAAIVQSVRSALDRMDVAPEDRTAIGMPMSLRDDPNLDRTVGMCLNTVPLLVAANASMSDIATEIGSCRRRRRVPYESIAADAPRTDSNRVPWLDVVVGVVESDRGLQPATGFSIGPTLESPFPLLVVARFSSAGCDIELVADAHWVDRDMFERFANGVRERILCVAGDLTADSSIVIGPHRDRQPGDLVDIFRTRAARDPGRPAVEDPDGTSLTYAELDVMSDAIARRLSPSGGTIEEPIAILADPGISFCAAVLAALKVGGAAMPLSTELPTGRIERLLATAKARRILIGDDATARRIDALKIRSELESCVLLPSVEVSGSASKIQVPPDPDRACYVLFTSGSTGTPKAVRMRHGGLFGLVEYESSRLGPDSRHRTGQFAPLGFDVMFQELFATWATGGVVVSIASEVRRDPRRLREEIERRAIARMHLPPLMLRALAGAMDSGFPDVMTEIVCAGEQLRIDGEVRRAGRASAGGVRILNQYGPTETHVVTCLDLGDDPDRWPDLPSIGMPICGVEIRILDPSGHPVPPGVAGELVVMGDALALGYLDGPTGGFSEVDGLPAYRTGDLARLTDDGEIEYLGRSDEQVKVSGYRVEPGEIEAVLASVDSVREAAVVAVDTEYGHRLVAFVVGEGPEDPGTACRAACESVLPSWMHPSAIWTIDSLPRSSNGKIHRADLRAKASELGVDHVVTASGISAERVLDILRATDVDPELIDRPLGSLGLDSLGAIRLQLSLRREFDVDRPVATLLATTIRSLREGGERRPTGGRGTEPRIESPTGEWIPLDPLARDVLAEDAMSRPGSFHLAWTIDFIRDVPVEEIEARMSEVLGEFPTLRTCRRADRGQLVLDRDEGPVAIDRFDVEPDRQELVWLLGHRLSVAEGSPWRLATWPRSDGGRTLLVVMHHVAIDGRTASVVLDRLADASAVPDASAGSGSAPPPMESHERWWVDRLRDDLGDQRLDPAGEVEDETLAVDSSSAVSSVVERSMRMAAERGMPPIVPSVIAWGILLARANGRRRAVIGVPFATDVEDAGFGTAILPVVVDAGDDRDLGEVVARVSDTIGLGLEHRHASLGRIVRALDPASTFLRPPLDGVITQDDAERRVPGALIRWCSTESSVFRAGLMIPTADSRAPVVLEIERTQLQGEEPGAFLERFSALLEQICDRMGGARVAIGGLEDRSSASIRRLQVFGAADSATPGGSVIERFDQTVAGDPTAIAIEDAEERVEYRELQAWSNRLAGAIIDRFGPLNGRSVVLGGGRSASTVASMLAVARAGGVFVPIESQLPSDRRRMQFAQAAPVVAIGSPDSLVDFPDSISTLDPQAARGGLEPDLDRFPTVSCDDAFYVMFTSGTTGEPRGAVIPHRAVLRLVEDPWFLPAPRGFRMLNAAPLAFDASTLEIWWPLLNGGTVCCWERSAADLPGLHDRVRGLGVRGCWLTATLFHAAVDGLPEFFDHLDLVLTGGDVVSADHVSRLLERRPGLAVVNGYGPTENTVFTACEPLVRGGFSPRDPLPIGRPVRGTSVRILEAGGRAAPLGRYGELIATGTGVGLGYLDAEGRPERRDGFDLDPDTGEPRYRTGDRARWRPDGRLEFGGRIDAQVKIDGRRIELTAIDAALREDPKVRDACVSIQSHAGRPRIVGLVVPIDARGLDVDRVLSRLANRLPAWEIPAILQPASEIPMTTNGKPDRDSVSTVLASDEREEIDALVASDADLYDVVCGCVETVTGRSIAGPDALLLDSGVDSLDLLRIAIELEARVARPVRLADVLEGGTPRAIAERIASDIEREFANVVTLRPGTSSASRSLFCIPGVGGTVFSFETILAGLPDWLPVYGLPYPGAAGAERPLRRVEALGELFAERIRETAPVSVIVGYSLGGFVAFETARRIARYGRAPRVVVIDSTPAALPKKTSLASRLTSRRQWKMRLHTVLPRVIVDRIEGNDGRMLRSLRTVVAAGFDAIRAYDPSPAPVDVTLIRTAQTDFHTYRDVPDLGWGEIADRVDVVEISCAHLEVFRSGSMELSRAIRNVVRSTRRSTDR